MKHFYLWQISLIAVLPFRGLSICLSVMFVYCAQTAEAIDTISFAYNSPIPLADRVLGDIRWQIASE